jgi:hypothetical protein
MNNTVSNNIESTTSVKHTPGPWEIKEMSLRDGLGIFASDNMCALAIVYPEIGQRFDEGKANARLIAAAPELLEALQTFVQYATNGNHPRWKAYLTTVAGARMLDAIAKAEGRA